MMGMNGSIEPLPPVQVTKKVFLPLYPEQSRKIAQLAFRKQTEQLHLRQQLSPGSTIVFLFSTEIRIESFTKFRESWKHGQLKRSPETFSLKAQKNAEKRRGHSMDTRWNTHRRRKERTSKGQIREDNNIVTR